ncbi:hypothetical protein HT031_006374 [Scenedesmus sp. PABB004]|nr:hypothetical protein HT031_006374 [Scenedesmus sp. PABB004]
MARAGLRARGGLPLATLALLMALLAPPCAAMQQIVPVSDSDCVAADYGALLAISANYTACGGGGDRAVIRLACDGPAGTSWRRGAAPAWSITHDARETATHEPRVTVVSDCGHTIVVDLSVNAALPALFVHGDGGIHNFTLVGVRFMLIGEPPGGHAPTPSCERRPCGVPTVVELLDVEHILLANVSVTGAAAATARARTGATPLQGGAEAPPKAPLPYAGITIDTIAGGDPEIHLFGVSATWLVDGVRVLGGGNFSATDLKSSRNSNYGLYYGCSMVQFSALNLLGRSGLVENKIGLFVECTGDLQLLQANVSGAVSIGRNVQHGVLLFGHIHGFIGPGLRLWENGWAGFANGGNGTECGAGLHAHYQYGTPLLSLTGVEVANNTARNGAGICLEVPATAQPLPGFRIRGDFILGPNVTFEANRATLCGGALATVADMELARLKVNFTDGAHRRQRSARSAGAAARAARLTTLTKSLPPFFPVPVSDSDCVAADYGALLAISANYTACGGGGDRAVIRLACDGPAGTSWRRGAAPAWSITHDARETATHEPRVTVVSDCGHTIVVDLSVNAALPALFVHGDGGIHNFTLVGVRFMLIGEPPGGHAPTPSCERRPCGVPTVVELLDVEHILLANVSVTGAAAATARARTGATPLQGGAEAPPKAPLPYAGITIDTIAGGDPEIHLFGVSATWLVDGVRVLGGGNFSATDLKSSRNSNYGLYYGCSMVQFSALNLLGRSGLVENKIGLFVECTGDLQLLQANVSGAVSIGRNVQHGVLLFGHIHGFIGPGLRLWENGWAGFANGGNGTECGAGLHAHYQYGTPLLSLTGVEVANNTARNGGGVCLEIPATAQPLIPGFRIRGDFILGPNVTFEANRATLCGGALATVADMELARLKVNFTDGAHVGPSNAAPAAPGWCAMHEYDGNFMDITLN